MRLTLTFVGQPKDVNTKYGLKQKFSVKAAEYGDNYLDVWSSPATKAWEKGQIVEVLEVKSREYNGKTYYDVVMPKNNGTDPAVLKRLEALEGAMTKVKLVLKMHDEKLNPQKVPGTDLDYPQMEAEPNFDVEEETADGITF